MDFAPVLQWKPLVEEIAALYSIEPLVILAVIWLESRGDPAAFNNVSQATGLMQIIPQEAGPPFGDRPTIAKLRDPRINIEWGIKILGYYKRKEKGNLWGAIYRYSGGDSWGSYARFTHAYWKPLLASKRLLAKQLEKMDEPAAEAGPPLPSNSRRGPRRPGGPDGPAHR